MKAAYYIALSTLIAVAGCKKDVAINDNLYLLTSGDQESFEGLQAAYANAGIYNDSLIWCAETSTHCTDSLRYYYDSMYHHHDRLFDHFHGGYTHHNEHDDHHHDHHHDHHGMHHQGNFGHHDPGQGHHEHDHELMDSLHHAHGPYHP